MSSSAELYQPYVWVFFNVTRNPEGGEIKAHRMQPDSLYGPIPWAIDGARREQA
ncbi:MAG: hypothetical protein OZSIB_1098 [Candidatus Ozemobacter sibiricus]|uniref:Uncharacterized protein n=1 Tax=Candidatus Ozemobacter sibiricus TaxID=2268124 RepID=A0A367ZKW6_9BACT|nr:MAG: hypothetical protein OZSIB_1098 [Candidatus Ozemobacter sibiricus]